MAWHGECEERQKDPIPLLLRRLQQETVACATNGTRSSLGSRWDGWHVSSESHSVEWDRDPGDSNLHADGKDVIET